MIEINEQFDVPTAPPRFVWDLLSDPRDVVECVPGAALGDKHEDGSFDGSLTVKFGPAKVTFRARIELELDAARWSDASPREAKTTRAARVSSPR